MVVKKLVMIVFVVLLLFIVFRVRLLLGLWVFGIRQGLGRLVGQGERTGHVLIVFSVLFV